MLITIPSVVDADLIHEVVTLSDTLAWEDGRRTAGATARTVKQNLQARLDAGAGAVIHTRLLAAIEDHPVLRSAARPHRISRLLLSKTHTGGGYGTHVDNPMMGHGTERMRTDLSFTLFLSPPDAYAGGELELEGPGTVHALKANAGDLVLYPTSRLHRVAPVTAGARLACVGWIQSLIPDDRQREILLDLDNLQASLKQHHDSQSAEMLVLQKSIANLTRMWAHLS